MAMMFGEGNQGHYEEGVAVILHSPFSIFHSEDGFVILNHGLALAPAANWSRYGLDASLFWCNTNAVGGLVGTFLGAAVDDDPAKIVNAQFELFPADGRIALRYDLSRAGEGPFLVGPFENGTNHFASVSSNTAEVVFQWVHPDDWDMDGLANSLDDDPRVAATNGGWNQSAAWAALSFPSNAAEIAAAGGYLPWAEARAADPNRRLVRLKVSSVDGSWPVLLTFGDKRVMCDCKEDVDASPHFFGNENNVFSAVVTNCHADAYIDCTWSGGEGMVFSSPHSLQTVVTWQTTNSVVWATNWVTLVTTYAGGYAITNGYAVTVGTQTEPSPTLTVSCPAVQFLNDGIGGDREERYYPVTFTLLASPGTGGEINVSFDEQTASNVFWDPRGDTPYDRSRLELMVPSDGGYICTNSLYMKSARI